MIHTKCFQTDIVYKRRIVDHSIFGNPLYILFVSLICSFCVVIVANIEGLDASEDILVFCAGVGTILLLVMCTALHKEWEIFLENILDFSVYGKPDHIDEVLTKGNLLGKWFGYYYILGCLVYAGISTMDAANCNKVNNEHNLHVVCDTFVPLWLPFDIPNKLVRHLIFVAQLLLVIMAVNPGALICFLTYQCTEVLSLHVESLKKHFRKIIVAKDIRYRADGIGYWVRYHNHILRLADTFRVLVKKSVGHIVLISGFVFGCAETQMIKGVKPLGALFFFIGWLVVVILLCHAGESLTNSFFSIHDAVRDSDWYLATRDIQKDVILILLKTQQAVYLEALPLGVMNYSMFIMILKTSYSYMTLLNKSV